MCDLCASEKWSLALRHLSSNFISSDQCFHKITKTVPQNGFTPLHSCCLLDAPVEVIEKKVDPNDQSHDASTEKNFLLNSIPNKFITLLLGFDRDRPTKTVKIRSGSSTRTSSSEDENLLLEKGGGNIVQVPATAAQRRRRRSKRGLRSRRRARRMPQQR